MIVVTDQLTSPQKVTSQTDDESSGSLTLSPRLCDRWQQLICDEKITQCIVRRLEHDKKTLLDLRLVNQAWKGLVQPCLRLVFETIYLHYPLPPSVPKSRKHISSHGLKHIVAFPQTLALTIHPTSSAKGVGRDAEWRTLISLFANLVNLKKLVIIVGSDLDTLTWQLNPAGAGRPLWLYSWPHRLLGHDDLSNPTHTHSLLELRHALLMCSAPELFELELRNWTIAACMLLRDRPFSTFIDLDAKQVPSTTSSPCMFWRRIRKLSVTMVKWWRIPLNTVDQQLYRDGNEANLDIDKGARVLHKPPLTGRFRHLAQRENLTAGQPRFSVAGAAMPREMSHYCYELRQDDMRVMQEYLSVFSRGIHKLEWRWVKPVVVHAGNPRENSTTTRLELQRCTGACPVTVELWPKNLWWKPAPLQFPKLLFFQLYDVVVSSDMIKMLSDRMNALERFVIPLKNLNVKTGLGEAYVAEDGIAYAVLNLNRSGRLFKDTKEVMSSRARYRERMEQTAKEMNLF